MSSDAEVCGSKVDGIARPINNLNRENSLLALWEGKLLLSEKKLSDEPPSVMEENNHDESWRESRRHAALSLFLG